MNEGESEDKCDSRADTRLGSSLSAGIIAVGWETVFRARHNYDHDTGMAWGMNPVSDRTPDPFADRTLRPC